MTTDRENVKYMVTNFDDGNGVSGAQTALVAGIVHEHFGKRGVVLLEGHLKRIGQRMTLEGSQALWGKLVALDSA